MSTPRWLRRRQPAAVPDPIGADATVDWSTDLHAIVPAPVGLADPRSGPDASATIGWAGTPDRTLSWSGSAGQTAPSLPASSAPVGSAPAAGEPHPAGPVIPPLPDWDVPAPGRPASPGPGDEQATTALQRPPATPPALFTRVVAAEVGAYVGAGLAATAVAAGAYAGWDGWSRTVQLAVVAVTALGLCAAALWLREPGHAGLSAARRRATSVLLVAGVSIAVGAGIWASADLDIAWLCPAVAGLGILLIVGVDRVASTPLSQTAILAWCAVLVAVAPLGPWAAPVMATLGLTWTLAGWRYLSGRRTAVTCGVLLVLGSCVLAAGGQWPWPARGVLMGLGVWSFAAFLRGGRNVWLALGIASWAALAATAAGLVGGPLLALLVGGVVTLVVSLIALRRAAHESRSGRAAQLDIAGQLT